VLLDCWAKAEAEISSSTDIILMARTAGSIRKRLFVRRNCIEHGEKGQIRIPPFATQWMGHPRGPRGSRIRDDEAVR
jgi:hypothetical protein